MLSLDISLSFPHLAMTFSFGDSIRTYAQTTITSRMKRSVKGDGLVTVMCHVSKESEGVFLCFCNLYLLNSFRQNTINQINTLGCTEKKLLLSRAAPEVEKRINLSRCITEQEQFTHTSF